MIELTYEELLKQNQNLLIENASMFEYIQKIYLSLINHRDLEKFNYLIYRQKMLDDMVKFMCEVKIENNTRTK